MGARPSVAAPSVDLIIDVAHHDAKSAASKAALKAALRTLCVDCQTLLQVCTRNWMKAAYHTPPLHLFSLKAIRTSSIWPINSDASEALGHRTLYSPAGPSHCTVFFTQSRKPPVAEWSQRGGGIRPSARRSRCSLCGKCAEVEDRRFRMQLVCLRCKSTFSTHCRLG